MKDTPSQTTSSTSAQKSTGDTRLVLLTRRIRAPVRRVWEAFSTGDMIRQWWGPDGYSSPRAEIDFKEGGKFLFGMKSPEGEVNWSIGSIKTIEADRRIVFDESFGNEQGQPITPKEAGLKDWPGDYHGTITADFDSEGEHTILTIRHEGVPSSMHDECVEGWSQCLDKLQKLVERQ